MKKIFILIISLALITACSVNNNINTIPENENVQENENNGNEIKKPVMAPNFELESIDGSIIKLSDLREKNVILNFWYTGCGFCVMEMPDLQKLQDTYKDENLLILAINVGETKETIQTFIEENKLSLSVLLDKDMKVADNYGIRSFPTTIAVNKKGEIVSGYVGMLNYEQMEQLYRFFE